MVPPKSHSTTSPGPDHPRLPGSWWGLAAFSPAATMAKFTRWWPSATRRRPSSADTSASVRPTSAMRPGAGRRPGRRRPPPAQRRDLVAVLHRAQRAGDGRSALPRGVRQACWRSTRKRAQVGRPPPAPERAPPDPPPRPIGSSVSPNGTRVNTPGRSTTRGASRRGTTRVASPVDRHHQHREPFQRHRLVAGQPGQVGPHRQQQHVDPWLGHGGTDPGSDRQCMGAGYGATALRAAATTAAGVGHVDGGGEAARLARRHPVVLEEVRRRAQQQGAAVVATELAGVDAEALGAGDLIDDLATRRHAHAPVAEGVGRPDVALGVEGAAVGRHLDLGHALRRTSRHGSGPNSAHTRRSD
jgi:hypothetical protein